jgi:hypothetical protein
MSDALSVESRLRDLLVWRVCFPPPSHYDGSGLLDLGVSVLPMVAQPLLLGTDGPLPPLQDLLVLCMACVLSTAVFLV